MTETHPKDPRRQDDTEVCSFCGSSNLEELPQSYYCKSCGREIQPITETEFFEITKAEEKADNAREER